MEQKFQKASSALCIATSTLELGIDIGDINVVLLYGHPGGWESFLQRIGRGNRRGDTTNVVCLSYPQTGSRFADILAFEALLAQIRTGRIERERPLEIYGAAVQQILSVILERGGSYRPVAEFVDLFARWNYLERKIIEDMLNHLAELGYIQPHDFYNRFGANPNLHRLRDLRLIWGNFPARSRDVQLRVNGRELGSVPATNLLRIMPKTTIRFAGRYWNVRRVGANTIEVEPSRLRAGLDLTYGGTGAPQDPTVVEEMLRVLTSDDLRPSMPRELRSWFLDRLVQVRQLVGWDRLPVAHDHRGFHYLTFAGRLTNAILGNWFRLEDYEAGEIVLRTDRPIDLARLPSDVSELKEIASQVMRVPDNLTIFQTFLPSNLLER
ncbi:MAG: hypothetical protein C4345_01580, partial [Chloroflexota bacterium]